MLRVMNLDQIYKWKYLDLEYETGEKIRCYVGTVVMKKLMGKATHHFPDSNWIRKTPSKQSYKNPDRYFHDADVYLKL